MRLLIIGENHLICHYIMTSLIRLDNVVDYFRETRSGIFSLATTHYCAALLINPSKALIRNFSEIQTASDVAYIVLHENADVKDRIDLFNAGIDDYLDYPVDMPELQTRIKAAVRRRSRISDHILTYDDITFNLLSREVSQSGKVIYLTAKEKCLLETFLLNKGRILSKRHLEDKLLPWNKDFTSNVIEVHISSLRKKLGRDRITTLYGQGYRMG